MYQIVQRRVKLKNIHENGALNKLENLLKGALEYFKSRFKVETMISWDSIFR